MKRNALILLFSLLAVPLSAQETWPLERCIQYALAHNLDIREKQIEVAVRQTDLTQQRLRWLPSVALQIGEDFNWGRSVDMQESATT